MKLSLLSIALGAVLASGAYAQTPPPAQPETAKQEAPKTPEKKPEDKRTDLQKKYDEIVKKAKSQDGVFKVHRVDEKVYWEIPESKLGSLFLWQTEISSAPKELGYLGTPVGTRTIRFTQRENKVQLRNATFSTRAVGTDEGTLAGVAANTPEPILMQWDVAGESTGKDKGLLIDVTPLFVSDPQDFSIRGSVAGYMGVDSSKTYVDRVKAFPKNIETRTSMTIRVGPNRGAMFVPQAQYDASTAALIVHYSLVELPEKPMMGRLKDSRIGYFTVGFTEYGREDDASATPVEYITRFRLEKKDPTAEISEPVQPIVFYLAREVPMRWRKYLKQAVEDWQPAFEKAGFKNAIIAKDAPTLKEDPDWDPEDARYSVIRWAPSETMNAMGPSIQDPRSGETISAHVVVWNDVLKVFNELYFAQATAIDPRARRLPFSDELTGRLIQYVISHEVGHTLGLEHNFRASNAYTIKQLRDPEFTKNHGVSSSIMSYARFNYVAQPGDGVTQTLNLIGPYDEFAIEYGYKPLGKSSPEAEKPQLDLLLSRQLRDPYVRFGNYKYYGVDPTTQMETIGEDTVEATRLGLLNIDRIAKNYLLPATTKYGEDYSRLAGARQMLISQYITELDHVMTLVGGVVENDTHAGRGDVPVFRPVSTARQRAAVALLLDKGVRMPAALQDPNIVSKITPTGSYDANPAQSYVISGLLNESRLRRLSDNEVAGKGTYTVAQLTSDVFQGVFKDLGVQTRGNAQPGPLVLDANTRALHRNFLRTLDGRVNGSGATKTDMKAMAKVELRKAAKLIDANMARAKDPVTAAHLAEVRSDIVKILEDRYSKPGGAPAFNLMDLLMGGAVEGVLGKGCWENPVRTAVKKALESANGGN